MGVCSRMGLVWEWVRLGLGRVGVLWIQSVLGVGLERGLSREGLALTLHKLGIDSESGSPDSQ